MRTAGRLLLILVVAAAGLVAATAAPAGADGDDTISTYGGAPFLGSPSGQPLSAPLVGIAARRQGDGYWAVGRDGGVFSYGAAQFHGSTGDIRLNQPIVTLAATPSGEGYWLMASDGGAFTFGDAGFHGSLGHLRLNQPIVAAASTPSGQGYWMAAADGGLFAFGDAGFFGSAAPNRHPSPIVSMAATPSGQGYWMVAADGAVFTFGDAPHLGGGGLGRGVVSLTPTAAGDGYWLLARDGAIATFGSAPHHGQPLGWLTPGHVTTGMAANSSAGYWVLAGPAPVPSRSLAGVPPGLPQRLQAAGYWVGNGAPALMRQALWALQKTAGIARTGVFDAATARALDAGVLPPVRSKFGYVAEIDKGRQVLKLVRDGQVQWVFNISTGNGAIYYDGGTRAVARTPEGTFRIERQINGVRISSLGELYRPKYFVGGYAIHGSPSIPPYPASHGCVRVSNAAADYLWAANLLPIGTPVLSYT